MASGMDDLKSLIRSILISSPLEMQIYKLDKDYEEISGERIPFRTFGFRSLEDFLRSIPDVVQVHGSGSSAVLKVIVTAKSAHIDELISKQNNRKSRTRVRNRNRPRMPPRMPARMPPRRSGPPCYMNFQHPPAVMQYPRYPPLIPQGRPPIQVPQGRPPMQVSPRRCDMPLRYNQPRPFNGQHHSSPQTPAPPVPSNSKPPLLPTPPYAPVSPIYASPSPTYASPNPTYASASPTYASANPTNATSNRTNMSPNKRKESLAAVEDWCKSINEEIINNGAVPKNKPELVFPEEAKSPPAGNIWWRDRLEEGISTGAIPKQAALSPTSPPAGSCYFSDQDGYLSDGDDEPPEDEYINYNVPFAVQENLKKLIAEHKDGIWCAQVPNIYLKMFKKTLDYSEYGYRSLIQMCMTLEKIFHCHRPDNGDFMLFDKTKAIPTDVLRNLVYVNELKAKLDFQVPQAPTEPALVDTEDLLRETMSEKYPSGVMEYGEEIPRQFLPDNVNENEYIDVLVGEVYDPSKFWVLLNEHSTKLDMLMDEMQSFYTSLEGNLEIPSHMVKVGLYCAAKYNNEYHRAIIVKKPFEKTKIKVFYADYGTLSTVNQKDLLFLHRKFKNFPLQAIRARLASIWPPVAFTPWTTDASSRLLALVTNKTLVAHLFRINRERQILEIFLVDTSTDQDIYMNDTLVHEGLALFTNQEQQKKTLDPCKVPKYNHMHLIPTFEELEWGKTLSAGEVLRLSKLGYTEEYIFSNYYIEIEPTETKLTVAQEFLESHYKLLEVTAKLQTKLVLTNPEPTPNWTEELSKEEEELTNDISLLATEPSLSSLSEETTPSTDPPISPEHKIFAKPTIKPPPGFECIQPTITFASNSNQPQAAQPLIQNVLPQPILLAGQPVSIVTQQVIDPALFLQNAKQNELIQQFALSRMLGYQLSLPNAAWNAQQQMESLLIDQQKQLLIAQQNAMLFGRTSQWTTPTQVYQQMPASNCLASEQRQQLQGYVQRHIVNGNTSVLQDLAKMISSKNNQQEGCLFKIICQILLNPPDSELYNQLETVVTNLLNLLADCQIIDLATKLLGVVEQQNPPPTSTNDSVNDMLAKLLSQSSVKPDSISSNSSQSTIRDVTVIKTDPVNNKEQVQRRNKLVIKKALLNHPIHVLRFNNQLYVPLQDVFQFTAMEYTVDVVRKLVVMTDSTCSIINIRLNDHKELAEELAEYNITDPILHVILVTSIPNMTKILGSKENLIDSYKEFYKSIRLNHSNS